MQTLKSETKSWGFIKLVILSLAVFNFTALGQIQTYNIVAGFSDQSNPAGVWSYGKTSAGAATFDIFTTQMTGAWVEGCFLFRGSTACAHAVSYDDGTRILNWGNISEPVIRLGKFSGYPDLTALRFTAPNAGAYTIRITARSSWPTDDMVIRTNGLTAYATTLGDMLILHFTNSMSLAVGDTIDFVGSSYNGSSDYPMNGVYLSGSVTLDSGTGLPGVTFIPAGGPGYLTDPRVAADADPDGDLATNREEYLASTNPLDNTSGFKATVAAVPLIRFGSESNRVYRILRSDDLSTNRTVVATLTATNSVTSYVDASVYPNKGFYVIELLP